MKNAEGYSDRVARLIDVNEKSHGELRIGTVDKKSDLIRWRT